MKERAVAVVCYGSVVPEIHVLTPYRSLSLSPSPYPLCRPLITIHCPPQVLEIGPVGQAMKGSPPVAQLFAHTQRGTAFGDASGLVADLQAAAAQLPDDLKVRGRDIHAPLQTYNNRVSSHQLKCTTILLMYFY